VRQFTNGAANLTYLLRFGDTELVLRRPPFGVLAPGAHDMKREFKVLSRLWQAYDRAPRAFVFSDDPRIAGADFFVMEYRRGVVVRETIPEELGGASEGRRVGEAFVDAVADLHLVDPDACGLGDLGRPDGFVARQVDGWCRRWELARPGDAHPLMGELGGRLAAHVPRASRVSVLHNDLHLGNAQFAPGAPGRVRSLFDWDMATLGDPLVDLGGVLAYWRDDTEPRSSSSASSEPLALPSKDEVVERYAARTGLATDGVSWYHAFARWKIAIIMQQLYNRHLRGESNNERLAGMGANVGRLAEQAHALLGGR
jgi:aminoglycoside phosphotransferase (APT) family kinase protein